MAIPFKEGLSQAQQQSIQNLVKDRPSSAWNETDKANWNYATGNAALPTFPSQPAQQVQPVQAPAGTAQALGKVGENVLGMIPGGNIIGKGIAASVPSINAATQKAAPKVTEKKEVVNPVTGEKKTEVVEKQTETPEGLDQLGMDFRTSGEEGQVLSVYQQQLMDLQEQNNLMMQNYQSKLANYTKGLEARNQQAVSRIMETFAARKEAQKQINKSVLAGVKKAGIRAGRQRYATEIQQSIVSAEESAGIARLAELDRQEQDLIAKAQDASTKEQWKAFNDSFAMAMEAQKQKEDTIKDLHAAAMEEEDRMFKRMEEIRKQETFEMGVEEFGMEKEKFALQQEMLGMELAGAKKEEAMGYVEQLDSSMLSQMDAEQKEILAKQAGIINLDSYIAKQEAAAQAGVISDAWDRAMDISKITGQLVNPETGEVTATLEDKKRIADEYYKETGLMLDEAKINRMIKMDNWKMQMDQAEYNLELAKMEQKAIEMGGQLNENGKISLNLQDSLALSQKIEKSEDYKGFNKLNSAMSALKDFESLFDEHGMEVGWFAGKGKAELSSVYQTMMTQLKEAYELGVLSDSDIKLLTGTLQDPTKIDFSRGLDQAGAVRDSINKTKDFLDNKALTAYQNISTIYQDYDPSEIGALQNVRRWFEKSDASKKDLKNWINEAEDETAKAERIKQDEMLKSQMPELNAYERWQVLSSPGNFNSLLGQEVKLPSQEKLSSLSNGSTTLSRMGSGTITGIDGSKYWKQGLDFVVKGGKGAPVKAPFSGTVVDAIGGNVNTGGPLSAKEGKKQNSGFGNQVKVRLDNGDEIWISHLDKVASLRPGMRIRPGQILGTQGNTGMTYGNTGVHLDITMKKKNGEYYTAREVAALLGDKRINNNV